MILEQPANISKLPPAKPVFFNLGPNPLQYKLPLGCLPMSCEHGGRFDGNPVKEGWQEDSYWIGGYYGPNEEIDEAKVALAMQMYPPGYHYCANIYENSPIDIRHSKSEDIEQTIRKARKFFIAARKARPDLRYSIYNLATTQDYWVTARYQRSMQEWDEYVKAGSPPHPNSDDAYWLYGVASYNPNTATFDKLDDNAEYTRDFKNLQSSDNRLTYGYNSKGAKRLSSGLIDIVDFISLSLYDFYAGDDTEGYVKWLCYNAKKVGGGRKLYPFVWPIYHNSNAEVGGQNIPLEEWRLHVRRVFKYADGLTIWGIENTGTTDHKEYVTIALDEAERAVSKRPLPGSKIMFN